MPKLRRELTLFSATLLGLGIIIGAGIYALLGQAAGIAGAGFWLAFALAALVAIFTGLSYAELASMFPKAGSSYVYVKQALGSRKSLIAFLAAWMIIFELIISATTVSIAFASYFQDFFESPALLVALAVLALYTLVNLIGIRDSARLNNAMAFTEVAGLVLVIALGLFFGTARTDLLSLKGGLAGLLQATTLVFFAYVGFEALAVESEEAKNARRTIPLAIVLSVAISTLLYVLTAVASVRLLGADALAASNAPLSDAVAQAVAGAGPLLTLIALVSTSSTVLVSLITASRMMYGVASETSLPKALSRVNKRFLTPTYAVLTAFAIAALFLLFGGLGEIANAANFGALFVFVLVNASVIALRMKQPKARRDFTIPLSVRNVPLTAVLGIATSALLITQVGVKVLAAGALMLLAGTAFFVAHNKLQKHGTR